MNILFAINKTALDARSDDEEISRQEYVFNVLIMGFIILTSLAFIISLVRYISGSATAEHVSPFILSPIVLILFVLYVHSRIGYKKYLAIILLAMYFSIATFALYKFGYILTQGILMYVLVIVVSGILISGYAALIATILTILSLTTLKFLQVSGMIQPNIAGIGGTLNNADLVIYALSLIIILLVSWVSNSEYSRLLEDVRKSRKLIQSERDELDKKVRIRTQELENMQAQKIIELYRFAEFGQLNSSLVHDLANPLTAISINFNELLLQTKQNELLDHIHEGIRSMEDYVVSARRQLQSYQSCGVFNPNIEIDKILKLEYQRIKSVGIICKTSFEDGLILNGDSTKFDQILSNLIGNAIDSHAESNKTSKNIWITARKDSKAKQFELVIKDNGKGIPIDNLEKIFNAFYTTKKDSNGTGIGLTIVNKAVKDFNGLITVKSSARRTMFYVQIPLANTDALET